MIFYFQKKNEKNSANFWAEIFNKKLENECKIIKNVCNCPIAQKLAEIAIFFGNFSGGGDTKKFQKFKNVICSFQILKN